MTEFRKLAAAEDGRGARFEVHEFARKSHIPLPLPAAPNAQGQGAAPRLMGPLIAVATRQLCIQLGGGSALLEPGAFQYSRGHIQAEMQKNARAGGFFRRQLMEAGSGESSYATRFAGSGEVWAEPTHQHLLLARMEPGEARLLDDRAFYACEGSVEVSTHVHRSVTGMLAGTGVSQPRLEGEGVIVVESPVPMSEVVEVALDGEELTVDGDLLLMYSASLSVRLAPLVRGLRNAMRSGEGLVFTLSGRGRAWLTPTGAMPL